MSFKRHLFRFMAAAAPDRWLPPPVASIVMYHGVTPGTARTTSWTQVPALDFERQIVYLRRRWRPIPLEEMVDCLAHGLPLPERAVAVTFDDGLRNNLEVAAPILRRHGVPATFFIVSGFIEEGRPLWVDRLHLIAVRLSLQHLDERDAARRSVEEIVGGSLPPDPAAWVETFKRLPAARKNAAMARLEERYPEWYLGGDAAPYLPMNHDQLAELARDRLFTIGGHTRSHEILSRCEPAEARRQVAEDKQRLEAWLGRSVRLFAYPNGRTCDIDEAAVAAVRDAGYAAACTTVWDNVDRRRAEALRLPRLGLGNDDLGDPTLLLRLSLPGLHPALKRWGARLIPSREA